MKKAAIALLCTIFLSCWQFDNPADPAAANYQGFRTERISKLVVDPVDISLFPGITMQFYAKAEYEGGGSEVLTEGVQWTSSNTGVATVDASGNVATIVEGQATISFSFLSHSSDDFSASLDLDVIAPYTGQYVATYGDDVGGSGTHLDPWLTIDKGIAEAQLAGEHAVFVSEGVYDVSAPVSLMDTVNVYGGFKDNVWIRDPRAYSTEVHNSNVAGGTIASPNAALWADAGITNTTLVNGITIVGGAGDYSAGFVCRNGGSPTIKNCILHGNSGSIESRGLDVDNSSPIIDSCAIMAGSSTPNTARAIRMVNGSMATVKNCVINGGSSNTSNAVYFDNSNGSFTGNSIYGGQSAGGSSYAFFMNNGSSPGISANEINGGESDSNYGFYLNNASVPTIYNNKIYGGNGTTNSRALYILNNSNAHIYNNFIHGGDGNNCWAIYTYQANPYIRNNTMIGGGGSGTNYGVFIFNCQPYIQNNIIYCEGAGTDRGIYELDAGADPFVANYNNIYYCNDGLYQDFDSGISFQGVDGSGNFSQYPDGSGTTLSSPAASGNVSVPLLIDEEGRIEEAIEESDLSLVTQGGRDGSVLGWPFSTDKDGDLRTGDGSVGWSMGAYEYD